ncbi:MAG: T9SS type A sorting domain-containing protein, partial [Saprospiraceae bacterium]
ANNDGTTDLTGELAGNATDGFTPLTLNSIPYGTHGFRYVIEDGCGNVATEDFDFTAKDCKAPTAYCRLGINIELMPTGMVEVWASDIDAGSFDDCSEPVTLSFSADPTETSLIFTCNERGPNFVQLWVTDAAGNQSFCESIINVQSNDANECTDGTALGGTIATEMDEMVEDVTVNISGMQNSDLLTDAAGSYETTLATGGDYTISPTKTDNPLNGVTTFDLVLIRKHILGLQSLNSPYKIIAADANRSNSVSTLDMVVIRKLILGLIDEMPNNDSWRFVASDFAFPEPTNPWATEFAEIISHNDLTTSDLDNDFIAVKIGDVNNSAVPNALATSAVREELPTWHLTMEVTDLQVGEEYDLPFYPVTTGMEGYQFTLQAATSAVEILEITDIANATLASDHFNLEALENGQLAVSWDGESITTTDEPLFTLRVRANAAINTSDIFEITDDITKSEAYDAEGLHFQVGLQFANDAELVEQAVLYQNQPNPFHTHTFIPFRLAQAQVATLTITDATGKVLWQQRGEYTAGDQKVMIEEQQLPAAGVLFYTLETENYRATKRMIVLKK